jgi:hypothetical protein
MLGKLPPGVELAGYAEEWIQENPNAAEEARAGATAAAAKREQPASANGKAAGPRPPVRDDSSSSDSRGLRTIIEVLSCSDNAAAALLSSQQG